MTTALKAAIDCDIHPGVPDIHALLPYMEPFWQDSFVQRGLDGFDMMSYPLNAPITCRQDWRIKAQRPDSSLAATRAQGLAPSSAGIPLGTPLSAGPASVSDT